MQLDDLTRYNVEAGSEREQLVVSSIAGALAEVRVSLSRWLDSDGGGDMASQTPMTTLPDRVIYTFSFADRRAFGKEELMGDLMRELVVQLSLVRYWIGVGQAKLSEASAGLSKVAYAGLDVMLRTKRPPSPIIHMETDEDIESEVGDRGGHAQ